MSRLTFTLRHEPEERLDLSALTPKGLAGLDRKAIAALRIGQSKRGATVGDIFRVTGKDVSDIVFESGSERFDSVGNGLEDGTIRIAGDVGAQAGRLMRSGNLIVEGSAGPHAGSCMRGGRIEISDNAGNHLGGPLAGELAGMNGGLIIVRGTTGDYAADRMRRGLIAVLKGAGDYAGARMIAGTLVVVGGVGALPGYLMRRGSIILDRTPGKLSPSFVACGAPDLAFAGLLDRHLIAEGIVKRPLLERAPCRFGGDNAVLGLGEILFPAPK
ncbi:MAG: formylmethanofuran dehydrogenase subunit C [Rhizobiaceae bacterium]